MNETTNIRTILFSQYKNFYFRFYGEKHNNYKGKGFLFL